MTATDAAAIVTVYATFGSDEEARNIARRVVEEKLAACANILAPCRSIYRWQGRIEEANEVPILFKTTAAASPELLARIRALHSYDAPAAMVWPIEEAIPEYAEWVRESVQR
jgi:periplasmic divalent cation tolerance protein